MKFSSVAIGALLGFAAADWQFRSRPDLSPPQLNITIAATDEAAPGYLFVAPFSSYLSVGNLHGPRQSGPYIFTDKGELVWLSFGYYSIWAANFQAGRVDGKDVLFLFEGSHNPGYGHGHGHITFLDNTYETVKELRAGNHKVSDKHEFHIVDEKTGLLQIYQPVPVDLLPYGASEEQQWIVDARFQEVDIASGKVLFEWLSLEHVSPHESALSVNKGQAGAGFNSSDAWDYFHINSVDKDENGDYLLLARHVAALYKIDGRTGKVVWKLGGLQDKFGLDFDADFTFSFQHHARFLKNDGSKLVILLFDNSAHGTEGSTKHDVRYNSHSSGKIIEVDTNTWKAKLLFNGVPPDGLLAKSQGSTQVLDNGNVLVNWGSAGAVTEFNSDAEPIFHAYLDSIDTEIRAQNYRAFKYEWHGYPTEDIAVLSEVSGDDTNVYVSWNGDTETRFWRIYEVKDRKKLLISEVDRAGFETSVLVKNAHLQEVVVQAYDDQKRLLATSASELSQKEVLPYRKKEAKVGGIQSYFGWRFANQWGSFAA